MAESLERMENSMMALSLSEMISSTSSNSSLLSKSQYGQVVFNDLCDCYPTDCDIQCTYCLKDDMEPQPGDKIALFKVGWRYVSEYITFERTSVPEGQLAGPIAVVFPAKNLPKDFTNLYQLCYLTSGNVIAGASGPFSFRKPHESELIAVEDPNDPGLVMITSQFSQLQENLTRVSKEKNELYEKYIALETCFEQKKQTVTELLLEKEELEKKIEQLSLNGNELEQQKKKLQDQLSEISSSSQHSISSLKDSLSAMSEEKNSLQKSLQEKEKFIELQNETIASLQKEVEKSMSDLTAQNTIARFKETLSSMEIENARLQEALLQRSFELANQIDNVNSLKKENLHLKDLRAQSRERNEKLSQDYSALEERLEKLSLSHNKTVGEKLLLEQKLETSTKLIEELKSEKQHLEMQTCDMLQKIVLLEDAHSHCKNLVPQEKAYEMIDDELKMLIEEKQKFMEEKREFEERLKAYESGSPLNCLSSKDAEILNKRIVSIMNEKAKIREELVQEKHNNQELLKVLKEEKESKAAFSSRIAVLEHELASGRTMMNAAWNVESISDISGLPPPPDQDKTSNENALLKSLREELARVKQEKVDIQEKFINELQENESLRKKNENLLLEDSQFLKELYDTKESYNKLKKEFEMLSSQGGKSLEENLAKALKDKEMLTEELLSLRKEMVGKFSLEEAQKMKKEISSLKEKLQKQNCCSERTTQNEAEKQDSASCSKLKDQFDQTGTPFNCPVCDVLFPPGSHEQFVSHFENHIN